MGSILNSRQTKYDGINQESNLPELPNSSSFTAIKNAEAEVTFDENMLNDANMKGKSLTPFAIRRSEKEILKSLSKQYIAIAFGCFLFLTMSQVGSMILMLFLNDLGPVISFAALLYIICYVYWRRIKPSFHEDVAETTLWETPYPFAAVGSILGTLSQHATIKGTPDYSFINLLLSFFMIESFYTILVAAAYRNFMIKWKKKLKFRRLIYSAYLDKFQK